MKVQVVYCTHRTAPIEKRERLVFSREQAVDALVTLRDRFPRTEAVLLSTCNRVELYTAAEDDNDGPSHEELAEFVAQFHGLTLGDVFEQLFEATGEDAVRHLFSVAASLDSMVVGEPQILAQVKQAYALALDQQSTGPLTNEIFQASMRVAKRIATETSINERRVSIPSVAVSDFANEFFEQFDDKQVLVIGAGEMGEETLQYLHDEGVRQITVVNRSLPRAEELAKRWHGRAVAWDCLGDELAEADLVVSTTGAAEPVVSLKEFRAIELRRFQRPIFILDLAIPRDFEPAIGECLGVYLYAIDDLKKACDRNRRARDRELPKAMHIIEEETARFMAELNHRATGPIIKRLKQNWSGIKQDEMTRLFRKLPDLEDRDRREIDVAFDRLLNKLLHPPLHSLRDESRQGSPHGLLEALKRLFHLKD